MAGLDKGKRQFFAAAVSVNADNVDQIIAEYVEGQPEYDYMDYFGSHVRDME